MAWIVLAFLLGTAGAAGAQPFEAEKGAIAGLSRVAKDSTGLFIRTPPARKTAKGKPRSFKSAVIQLLRLPDSSRVAMVEPNEQARYFVSGISPGTYVLRASSVGYQLFETTVSITAGGTLHQDVVLGKVYPPSELPFGAEEARADFEAGRAQLRDPLKLTIWHLESRELIEKVKARNKAIREKYGFKIRYVGEKYRKRGWDRTKIQQAAARYNRAMKKLLEKRNGPDWYQRYEKEIAQVCRNVIEETRQKRKGTR